MPALATADLRRRIRTWEILRAGRRTTDVNPSARSVSVEKAGWWSQRLGVPVPPGTPTAALPSEKQLADVDRLTPEQRKTYLGVRAAVVGGKRGTHAEAMRVAEGRPAKAAKAPAKKAAKAFDAADTLRRLHAAESREEAYGILDGMTGSQLAALQREAGELIYTPSDTTIAAKRRSAVDALVGERLDAKAIRGDATLPYGPRSSATSARKPFRATDRQPEDYANRYDDALDAKFTPQEAARYARSDAPNVKAWREQHPAPAPKAATGSAPTKRAPAKATGAARKPSDIQGAERNTLADDVVKQYEAARRSGRTHTQAVQEIAGALSYPGRDGQRDLTAADAGRLVRDLLRERGVDTAPTKRAPAKKAPAKKVAPTPASDLTEKQEDYLFIAASDQGLRVGASADMQRVVDDLSNRGLIWQGRDGLWRATPEGRAALVASGAAATPAKKAPAKAAKKAAPLIAPSGVHQPTDLDRRIARLYGSDKSLSEVARELGISASTVHTSLTRQGVQLRPRGGAVKKAPAKKAPAKAPDSAAIKAHLATLDTRREAEEYLKGLNLTNAQLRQIQKDLDHPGVGHNKDSIINAIVGIEVGGRADSKAMVGNYEPADRPGWLMGMRLDSPNPASTAAADAANLTGADREAFLAWLRDNPGMSVAQWRAQRERARAAQRRAEFDPVDVAVALQRDVDRYTTLTSLTGSAETQARGEAGIRQILTGLGVGQVRRVASQFRMRPPAGMTEAQLIDWMLGQWRQSRGQWSLQ